jgi:hypothetical protein
MRLRPTYANVVSTLALVLVVSGGAYAAGQLPKHSVGNKQLKPSAVKSKKVKNGTLKAVDFKPGQLALGLTGTQLGGDLTGTFPNPTLAADVFDGLVRDADLDAAIAALEAQVAADLDAALDGVVAGARDDASLALPASSGHQALVALPDVVSVTASCFTAGPNRGLEVFVTNDSPGTWAVAFRQQSETPVFDTIDSDAVGPGDTLQIIFPPDSAIPSARYVSVTALSGEPVEVEVTAITTTLAGGCNVRGSAFVDGSGTP